MKIAVKELYIDGVAMPTPSLEGLTITTNKLWSANTGRLESTGQLVGTIVAIKRKVVIKWPDLSMEQAKIIENAVSSAVAFHKLKYTDMTGTATEISVYFGDPSYTIYSYSPGIQRIKDVSVDAIEK